MTDDAISERDGPTLEEMEQELETWRKSRRATPTSWEDRPPKPLQKPTPRQLLALEAYVLGGGRKQGAALLGISLSTFSELLANGRAKTGCDTLSQSVYLLGLGYFAAERDTA